MAALGLGIDAGGTATRWRLADPNGDSVAEGSAEPLSGHIFSKAAENRARRIIEGIARSVERAGRPAGIVAGITGLTRGAPADALVRRLFAGALQGSPGRALLPPGMWVP